MYILPTLYHDILFIISNLGSQSLFRSTIQNSGLALFWSMASTPDPFFLALSLFPALAFSLFPRLWNFSPSYCCYCTRRAEDRREPLRSVVYSRHLPIPWSSNKKMCLKELPKFNLSHISAFFGSCFCILHEVRAIHHLFFVLHLC